MISCVVVLDGRIMGVFNDGTYQWFLRSCVKFSQTAVVVVKHLVRTTTQQQKWEDRSVVRSVPRLDGVRSRM